MEGGIDKEGEGITGEKGRVNQIFIFYHFDTCRSGACCDYITMRTRRVHRRVSAIAAC